MKQRLASPLSIVTCSLSILMLLFYSCSSNDGLFPDAPFNPDGVISPTCQVYAPAIEVGTRGYGVKGEKDTLRVRLFRADQNPSSVWPTTCSGLKNLSARVNTSGTVTFGTDEEWYYLTNGKSSKLLGLYPSTTATVSTGNQITYTLDGSTDLMSTAWSNAAHKNSNAAQQPKLTFNHMLTQLIVSLVAEKPAAITAWGNINTITVEGMKNSCTLTLPIPTDASKPFIASSSGTAPFTARDIYGKAIAPKALTTDERVYGYCMIVPGTTYTSSSPLKLIVRTVQHPTGQEVYLPGPSVSTTYTFEAGKAYTIRLKMTAVEIIPTVSIAAWTDPGAHLNGEGDLGDWGNGGSIGNGDVTLRP